MSSQPIGSQNDQVRLQTSEGRRDRALGSDIDDVLRHDERTGHACIGVEVRGGVAHIHGAHDSGLAPHLVRQLISRIRGIHGVWDADPDLRTVDLGCGGRKQQPHAAGVDRYTHPGTDMVADLELGLPFASHSIDRIFAVHFLEHVRNLIELMNEIHRVLRAGGLLHVIVPNCNFVNAVADPTHVRFFHAQTFKFFCRPYPDLRLFRPLAISATHDNVFADLQPVQAGDRAPSDDELARYFD